MSGGGCYLFQFLNNNCVQKVDIQCWKQLPGLEIKHEGLNVNGELKWVPESLQFGSSMSMIRNAKGEYFKILSNAPLL